MFFFWVFFRCRWAGSQVRDTSGEAGGRCLKRMRFLRGFLMTALDLGPNGISTTFKPQAFCPLLILFLLGAGAAPGRLPLPVQLGEAAGVGGRVGDAETRLL